MSENNITSKRSSFIRESVIEKIQEQTLSLFNAFIIELDANGNLLPTNNEFFLRFLKDQNITFNLMNHSFLDIIEESERPNMLKIMDGLKVGNENTDLVKTKLSFNGKNIWLKGNLFVIKKEQKVFGIRGIFQNISDSITREKLIEYMAYNDNLTGLPNRISLEKKLTEEIEKIETQGGMFALGFLGLDNFKQINNALGYKMGDRILFSFSNRLLKKISPSVYLGRWSGDIFAFVLSDIGEKNQVHLFCQSLLEISNAPLLFRDSHYYVPFSAGFSLYPEDGNSLEVIFNNTEKTLNWVKRNGRNHYLLFSDLPNKGSKKNELVLRIKLTDAISQNKIEVYLQPKVDTETSKIIGMEALSRWFDEELGWVNPEEFINVAESAGLITILGDHIIRKSLDMLNQLNDYNLKLAINVSLPQLIQINFVEKLSNEVKARDLNPKSIILEITESIAMLETKQAIAQMESLKNLGFEISIDDFGTGYSSFSRLYQMPLDELKIDTSFIRRLNTEKGLRIVQAIIQIGHALHLRLVAEGVEDSETYAKLKKLGVDNIQGYYIEKPMPFEQFVAFLKKKNNENGGEANLAYEI